MTNTTATNPVKEVAKFIGWLTGSIAGVAAILYTLGYVTTQTHLYLLGVDSFLQYDHDYYLRKGGNFLIALGIYSVKALLAYGQAYYVHFLLVFSTICVCYFCLQRPFGRFQNLLLRLFAGYPLLWRIGVLCALGLILFVFLVVDMDRASAPLRISGLLFVPLDEPVVGPQITAALQAAQTDGLQASLLSHDSKALESSFRYVYVRLILAALLLIALRAITVGWRFRTLILLPFSLILLYYGFLLPAVFGVVMREAQFHPVKLVVEKTAVPGLSDDLFLLQPSDQGFTLWDRARGRVVWLKKDLTNSIEVRSCENPFEKYRLRETVTGR